MQKVASYHAHQFDNKNRVTQLVFELYALKAKITGVFSRSYCCYGNLLCHKFVSNMFTNDLAVFDTMILASTGIECS